MFAAPFANDLLPDAESLNTALKQLLLSRESEGDRYANPNPSLKQQAGVFESNFNLFSWPGDCIQQLRKFCWGTLGRTVQQLNNYSPEEMRRLQIYSHTWFHVTRHGGFTIRHIHPMASWFRRLLRRSR